MKTKLRTFMAGDAMRGAHVIHAGIAEDLVDAIESLLRYINTPVVPEGLCERVCNKAKDALARAAGEDE